MNPLANYVNLFVGRDTRACLQLRRMIAEAS